MRCFGTRDRPIEGESETYISNSVSKRYLVSPINNKLKLRSGFQTHNSGERSEEPAVLHAIHDLQCTYSAYFPWRGREVPVDLDLVLWATLSSPVHVNIIVPHLGLLPVKI